MQSYNRSKLQFPARIIIAVILSFAVFSIDAQDDFSIGLSTGITSPILDNGIGVHLGVNPVYHLSSRVAIEGQASYIYTKIKGSFLSGEKSRVNSFNVLVGPRLYLASSEKKVRPFLNLLLGGNYNVEQRVNQDNVSEFGLGFSGGAFVLIHKFLVGLSYDTPQNMILKIGYQF